MFARLLAAMPPLGHTRKGTTTWRNYEMVHNGNRRGTAFWLPR